MQGRLARYQSPRQCPVSSLIFRRRALLTVDRNARCQYRVWTRQKPLWPFYQLRNVWSGEHRRDQFLHHPAVPADARGYAIQDVVSGRLSLLFLSFIDIIAISASCKLYSVDLELKGGIQLRPCCAFLPFADCCQNMIPFLQMGTSSIKSYPALFEWANCNAEILRPSQGGWNVP